MKLYEISGQFRGLELLSEDPDCPLDAETLADTMSGIKCEFEDKAKNTVAVMTNMDADINALTTEIKRLQARVAAYKNRKANIRAYLQTNMSRTGITNITCPLFSISLAKGRPIALIDNADEIPARFLKTKLTKTPIKADILKALKDGDKVPGASLGVGAESLRIK